MASGAEITSKEYITHHLTNWSVGEGFWTWHVDTLGWSILMGLVFLFSFRAVAKKAKASHEAEGPIIDAGSRDDVVQGQDDVDDLLSSLGF